MDIKFVGVVLSSIDYKEKDKLVNIFSVTDGLVLGKLKSVKGTSSKLKVLASPFCFAEFTGVKNKDKIIITGADVIDTFFDITLDIDKYMVACCIIDFMRHYLMYEKDNIEQFFKLVISTLKELSYNDINAKVILIKFLCVFLDLAGFGLEYNFCSICKNKIEDKAYLDILDGAIKCSNCVGKKNLCLEKIEKDIILNIKNNIDMINYSINDNTNFTFAEKDICNCLKFLGNYVYLQFDYILKLDYLI